MIQLTGPRLRLASLMEVVAALAVPLAFWSWRHYCRRSAILDVLAVLVSVISIFVIASVSLGADEHKHGLMARWCRGLGLLNLLIAVWFGSVEWEWSFEECLNCRNYRRIFAYRLFSIVIRRDVEDWGQPTTIESVAADLGIPCSHTTISRSVHQRWGGLCVCLEHGGMRFLSDRRWYPPCARAAVRSWLVKDPSVVETFQKRVLEQHDRFYWRTLILRMYEACPADQLPKYPLRRDDRPAD